MYPPDLSAAAPTTDVIKVRRWPTERPLLYLNLIAATGLWIAFLRISPRMLGWTLGFAGLMALMRIAMIAQIRGSAIRLGPEQFPDIYRRVEELARRMELRRMPEVYLMQQDGALNAFATRFMRSHMVVLFADLLEACGSNDAARDMIIGHELGHIRAGHLRFHWILLPVSFVPFIGSALSRAREYTCDRYGRAAAGDEESALLGLTILAAGGKYGMFVDRRVFARQHAELSRSWMMVGQWMASHPPLSKRLIALKPDILGAPVPKTGIVYALRPAFAGLVVVIVGALSVGYMLPQSRVDAYDDYKTAPDSPAVREQIKKDFERLGAFLDAEVASGRPLPWDLDELFVRWHQDKKDDWPLDPFSGAWYDYDWRGDEYRVWSMGPDGENRTADDIVLDSRTAKDQRR